MNLPDNLTIRPAIQDDVPLILTLVKELAEYEQLGHTVTATEESLRESLFGEKPAAEVLIAEVNGQPVGFANFFRSFSSFVGRPGLYLDDLYVRPPYRRMGLGRAMLCHVAAIARDRNAGRFEWIALDWNDPAIRFYLKLGAEALEDWTMYRVTGPALDKLASGEFD